MEYLDKTGTQELIDKLKEYVDNNSGSSSLKLALNDIYPVGAMYLTIDKDFDPNVTFGGTWEAVEDGKYLMCANSKYEPGSTGGSNTHSMTIEEMPTHTHSITVTGVTTQGLSSSLFGSSGPSTSSSKTVATTSAGKGNAFTVQPNAYRIRAWRRTA